MYKRIIIICEGKTEQEFCRYLLSSYLLEKQITIDPPLIRKSKGGIVAWSALKMQIEECLKREPTVYVTTLIDYYGIEDKLLFPRWKESFAIADKNKRMSFLEEAMKADMDNSINYRFIPYIQLHEFEALLFTDKDKLEQLPVADRDELENTFRQFGDNPEMINNDKATAPSKRMKRIISGYDKVLYGRELAEAIGLDNMRKRCPRFDEWIMKLENV